MDLQASFWVQGLRYRQAAQPIPNDFVINYEYIERGQRCIIAKKTDQFSHN
jgi:hypothetical protein